MFQQQQFTPATVSPSIVADNPGTPIAFRRFNGVRNIRLTGVIVGVITSIPRRCQEVQFDYVVMPTDDQYKHLSGLVVNESDVLWGVCPRCNGAGHIAIRGDQDVSCPVCGFVGEVTF